MTYRPPRHPNSELERAVYALAQDADADALRTLAQNAGLDGSRFQSKPGDPPRDVGTIDASVVMLEIPRVDVLELLPLGLEPAPQPLTFPETHPVVVMYARRRFEAWFGTMEYDSVTIAVPYVQRTAENVAHRGPFIYIPRTYIDAETPSVLASRLYGFESQFAHVRHEDDTFEVESKGDARMLARASFTRDGPDCTPEDLKQFRSIRKAFDMPTISQALRIADDEAFEERDFVSPFLCTSIAFDFSRACTVTPLRAEIEFANTPRHAGLPKSPTKVPSIRTRVFGAFRLQTHQYLSLPGPCALTRFESPTPPAKEKVVILGGGPSALAAAYYLGRQTDRYDVELYTVGWRLGGKCAAGRNPDHGDRVEEHGLHAFVGFYENAIRTMREVWSDAGLSIEVGRAPYDYAAGEGPIAAAFIGCEDVGVFQRSRGHWRYFETPQTFNGKLPGLVPEGGHDPQPNFGAAIAGALRRVADDTESLLRHERTRDDAFGADNEPSLWAKLVAGVEDLVDVDTPELRSALGSLVAYVEALAVDTIGEHIEHGSLVFRCVAWALELVRGGLRSVVGEWIRDEPEEEFVWQGLDILITALIGVIRSRTVNFDDLDRHDFRQWLLDHGMDPRNRDASALTQVYETLFAHGHTAYPDQLAAGVGLRWLVMVAFLYKGYPAYFFKYSCPQTMMTPYFKALERFGVSIHFFHEVRDLVVEGSGAERSLTAIDMRVQATTKDGAPYDPFIRVPGNPDDLPGWPTQPKFDTLEQGEELQERAINLENPWSGWEGVGSKRLERGKDFDHCILGIPLSVLPAITRDVADTKSPSHCSQWTDMLAGMRVIQTISAQLWFREPLARLISSNVGMLTSYALPECSLGDFTHLLEWEPWAATPEGPRALTYHTGSLVAVTTSQSYPDVGPEFSAEETGRWKTMFRDWLSENYAGLFDRVASYEELLDTLVAPDGATGEARLEHQFFNISVHPSDYYVLSQPGAMGLRLGQAESRVQGLVLCGDWTRTGLNCGCVEASTQSGMLASRVLSNEPRYIWHPGF